MYYSHNIKNKLIEARRRLDKSNSSGFDHDLIFFLNWLKKESLSKSILQFATDSYVLSNTQLEQLSNGRGFTFENEMQRTSAYFQFINYLLANKWKPLNIVSQFAAGQTYDEGISNFLESYIDPIVHFVLDQMEEGNFVLYLLEKYKSRTEWFFKKKIFSDYNSATSNFEQTFEDDLRLYLFDQGIDYPFSTPKSASGRADIVSLIDTNNPLILEIKIYDKAKGYGKNRIIDGFNQIVKYSNDYNKNIGYLVVFNMDNIEIQILSDSDDKSFPNKIYFNNKIYYILIINLNAEFTASKAGKLNTEVVSKDELINNKVETTPII